MITATGLARKSVATDYPPFGAEAHIMLSPGSEGTASHDQQVPVLIVGGGIVGLSAALLLSTYGVYCTVIERRRDTMPEPRATGLDPRSMEIFRSVGIEEDIRRVAVAGIQDAGILRAESLGGRELGWITKHLNEGV